MDCNLFVWILRYKRISENKSTEHWGLGEPEKDLQTRKFFADITSGILFASDLNTRFQLLAIYEIQYDNEILYFTKDAVLNIFCYLVEYLKELLVY